MRLIVALLFVLFAFSAFILVAQTTKPAEVPTNSKDRKPHPATQPDEVLDMSIAELGNFDFDFDAKDPRIPADVKAMSGVTIKLHGFMIPIDPGDELTRFALVPSLHRPDPSPPTIQQTILVACPKGMSVKYCPDEVIVQGKLAVDIINDDGFVVGIFSVEPSDVKPAGK